MRRFIVYIFLLAVIFYSLFPFLWTVITALKPPEEVFSLPVSYLPSKLSLENFSNVFVKRDFGRYIINSLIVAFSSTVVTVILSSLIAFKLRYIYPERAINLQKWLLIIAIIPPALFVVPLFIVLKSLNLVNNYLGLIIAYTFLNFPFGVWMIYAGFSKIPKELDYAGYIDGFSKMGVLFRILLPLSKPTVSVVSILVFIFCWNEFLIALTLMPDERMYTVPVGISMLSGVSIYEIPWGEINAAVTITTLPVIVLIGIFQKWIIEGLTAGAIKG